jgi:AraC-like DNA-binding protein
MMKQTFEHLQKNLIMESTSTEIRLSKRDFALIMQARAVLDKEMLWNYTIPQLAIKVKINEKKLKFGFKLLYGTTIHEFVAKEKLEKAKELLGKNELPISEIANRSGYNSISYFSQAFKRAFNVTPSQWISQFEEN